MSSWLSQGWAGTLNCSTWYFLSDALPTCSWGRNQSHHKYPFSSLRQELFKDNGKLVHMTMGASPPPPASPMHLSLHMLGTWVTWVMSLITEAQCCSCVVQPLTDLLRHPWAQHNYQMDYLRWESNKAAHEFALLLQVYECHIKEMLMYPSIYRESKWVKLVH